MESIITKDGVKIPYTWNHNGYDTILMYCHGIASDRDEDGIFSDFHNDYFENSADAFFFDFQGHGESEILSKHATINGMRCDLRACIEFILGKNYNKIIIIAASFGASIVLLEMPYFKTNKITTFVFWNPVISYQETFVYPKVDWATGFFPGADPLNPNFSTSVPIPDTDFIIGPQMAKEIATLHPEKSNLTEKITLLCIHGTKDHHVPFKTTEKYCSEHITNAELNPIIGAAHGFAGYYNELYETTFGWLKKQI